MRGFKVIILLLTVMASESDAQEALNRTLLRADKHYIKGDYALAVIDYLKYLEDYPRDYYASRQTARCYDKLNDAYNAIDFWPIVAESSEVTDADYLDYAKCLLANNREADARKIFRHLSRSKNPSVAAWGHAYLQPSFVSLDTVSAKVYALNNVNSTAAEFAPLLYRDKLFFVQQEQAAAMNYMASAKSSIQKVKVYIPKDSLNFLPSLLFEKLQQLDVQGSICFSPDGKRLYFSAVRAHKDKGLSAPVYAYQLFRMDLASLNSEKAEAIPFEYNMPLYNIMHPSISADGKRLYFSSNRPGSMGAMDIFYCERNGESWSFPVNAGPEINSSGNEVFPFMSEDSVLYFSSDQRPGFGGLDFFCAKADQSSGGFEKAINCGAALNSRFDDYGIYVLKGGKKAYFSSKRGDGKSEDLYYFLKR